MVSYRASLTKIGIPLTAAVWYRGFASRPKSLRQAIRFDGRARRPTPGARSPTSSVTTTGPTRCREWRGMAATGSSQPTRTRTSRGTKTKRCTCSKAETRCRTATGRAGSSSRACRTRSPARPRATTTGDSSRSSTAASTSRTSGTTTRPTWVMRWSSRTRTARCNSSSGSSWSSRPHRPISGPGAPSSRPSIPGTA